MSANSQRTFLISTALGLLGLPLLLWATGDVPRRTLLKEFLAVLTVLSFCLMLGQFYLARGNDGAINGLGLSAAMRYHKAIGYGFIGVLLVHPFFVVAPRLLESGIGPLDAFVTMVTAFDSVGIVAGLTAWGLLVVLLITSLVRKRLPLTYRAWRILHGILSVLFVTAAIWHAIDLGRHTDLAMSIYLVTVAFGGVTLLVRGYTAGAANTRRESHE